MPRTVALGRALLPVRAPPPPNLPLENLIILQAATGVLRYLAGSKGFGITYGASAETIVGYIDADYAGDVDTRRSTTGFVFILFGGAVSWSSKRQATVAASTTEAEYIAMAAAVREALWLRQLLKDLAMVVDTVAIFADNQSAIKLVEEPGGVQPVEAHRRGVPLCARARGAQGGEERVREDQRHAGPDSTSSLSRTARTAGRPPP